MRVVRNKTTAEIFTVDNRGKRRSYGWGPEAEVEAFKAASKANAARERYQAMRDIGMVRVKGGWE